MRFIRENFTLHGGFLSYYIEGEREKFVARFKYGKGGAGSYMTFLIKNFTTEEYFSRLQAGEAPLLILESKGYVAPAIKKVLKAAGFPATVEGKKAYIARFLKEGKA